MLEKVNVLSDPSLRDSGNMLINGRDAGQYITIMGRCKVEYDGRASSTLGLGDRHITLQPDGCVRVDTDENRKPVNWQPPGAEYTARLTDDETLRIHASQKNPDETLDIEFTDIYFITSTSMKDKAEFNLSGTEKEMQDYLFKNPDLISEALGFSFIPKEKEKSISVGSIDIFGYSNSGSPVVLELKRKRVGPEAVDQLNRYVEKIQEIEEKTEVHGVLVAPSITESTEEQIKTNGYKHIPFDPKRECISNSSF